MEKCNQDLILQKILNEMSTGLYLKYKMYFLDSWNIPN